MNLTDLMAITDRRLKPVMRPVLETSEFYHPGSMDTEITVTLKISKKVTLKDDLSLTPQGEKERMLHVYEDMKRDICRTLYREGDTALHELQYALSEGDLDAAHQLCAELSNIMRGL